MSTFKVAVASLNFYDEGNITYGTSVITADITDLVLRLALTFLSSAVPIACSSSFVLVGSWPAMIFVGRTVRLIPVMTSTTDNSQQSLAGAEKAKPSLTRNPEQAALRGVEKAKPSLIRNPEQALTYKETWPTKSSNSAPVLQYVSGLSMTSLPTCYTSTLSIFVTDNFTVHHSQRHMHHLQYQW